MKNTMLLKKLTVFLLPSEVLEGFPNNNMQNFDHISYQKEDRNVWGNGIRASQKKPIDIP